MSTSAAILREIESAASDLGLAPSTLCQRAVHNAKLPVRLAEGKSVTVDTLAKLRSYIAAQRRAKRKRPSHPEGAAA